MDWQGIAVFLYIRDLWRQNGAMKTKHNEIAMNRATLRLPPELLAAIDADRSCRPGNVSRNTWIIEAVMEKLSLNGRELTQNPIEASNG